MLAWQSANKASRNFVTNSYTSPRLLRPTHHRPRVASLAHPQAFHRHSFCGPATPPSLHVGDPARQEAVACRWTGSGSKRYGSDARQRAAAYLTAIRTRHGEGCLCEQNILGISDSCLLTEVGRPHSSWPSVSLSSAMQFAPRYDILAIYTERHLCLWACVFV